MPVGVPCPPHTRRTWHGPSAADGERAIQRPRRAARGPTPEAGRPRVGGGPKRRVRAASGGETRGTPSGARPRARCRPRSRPQDRPAMAAGLSPRRAGRAHARTPGPTARIRSSAGPTRARAEPGRRRRGRGEAVARGGYRRGHGPRSRARVPGGTDRGRAPVADRRAGSRRGSVHRHMAGRRLTVRAELLLQPPGAANRGASAGEAV